MHLRVLCLLIGLTGIRAFGFLSDQWLSEKQIHRVIGEPARIERAHDPAAALRIMTWNIERGQAYEAVLSILHGLHPDVVLLQEVDDGCRRTGYRNVARDLAEALEMNWVAAGEFEELGEGRRAGPALTGQAVLSRFPIEDASLLRFKAQSRWRWSLNPVQPRRGGRIALRVQTAGILLYDTHIESGGDRRLQQRQMAEIIADQARTSADTPIVVAGDFNHEIARASPRLRSLAAASFVDALGDDAGRGPTAQGQRQPIDWIFVKHMEPGTGRVIDAPPTASDHFPVMATLGPFATVARR